MAEVTTNNKVISKVNQGFPEWLDFDKMRREGMDYLGELSGNIWTDHNTHDPGITILEMLCYALLDLGYRTSLPVKDLFARNPEASGIDEDFFSPAQILACNPVTIMDYRRLLTDLPNVRNAWLTVAENITPSSICRPTQDPAGGGNLLFSRTGCISFIDGLYHVYVDLEENLQPQEINDTILAIRKALMSHRNLCEDFYDITILCKQPVGVCADITIGADVDPDTVMLEIIQKLRDFFSPTPKFYRLKDLIQKGRSIEEAFAGRPFDLTKSHGFLDVNELEQIQLKKEIHLSDLYQVIFNVTGVTAVQNLNLRNCDGSTCNDQGQLPWIFRLYENYVPQFNLDCSGFHIIRQGINIQVDLAKYKEYFRLNFSNSGKTLMEAPSTGLDLTIPVGNYRSDIADYYPLENDFPKVYGIAEGSLPDTASVARKAQSLQMRGYLLFFDHLLAGYLGQLKNMRNLFSIRGQEENHTYFINKLDQWPGLDKLLRFTIEDDKRENRFVAFPVGRMVLQQIIDSGGPTECDFEPEPYLFCSANERDIAIRQFMDDVVNGLVSEEHITTAKGCNLFYLSGSSPAFVIFGVGEYKTNTAVQAAATSVSFLASEQSSYRGYVSSDQSHFSFNIYSNMAGYWNYLQMLTEDSRLYTRRRKMFLDHLLARFAETFTDYALLSFSFFDEQVLQLRDIKYKQSFLANYSELSSTRGKGYDYMINGWNNENLSGFEKRVAAYAGLPVAKRKNHCHFEVIKFEEQAEINVALGNKTIFSSEQVFENRDQAKAVLGDLLNRLQDQSNYEKVISPIDGSYGIQIKSSGAVFDYRQPLASAEDRDRAILQLNQLFSNQPPTESIYPTQYSHQLFLTKKQTGDQWIRKEPLINEEKELTISPTVLEDFNDRSGWIAQQNDIIREEEALAPNKLDPSLLINIRAFDHDVNRVDVKNHVMIYQFTINDPERTFFFLSSQQFEEKNSADDAVVQCLFLLADQKNYQVFSDSPNVYYLRVANGSEIVATNTVEYGDETGARLGAGIISNYVNAQIYLLSAKTVPYRWQYSVPLGLPDTEQFEFKSKKDFDSREEAMHAAAHIIDPLNHYDITIGKSGELELKDEKHPRTIAASFHPAHNVDVEASKAGAKGLLAMKKTISKIMHDPALPEAEGMIIPDRISRQGNFGYQLVEKDGYHAWYHLGKDFRDPALWEEKIAELFKVFSTDVEFLEICYGGDNIVVVQDSVTKSNWYHYTIKARPHDHVSYDEFVLFESVRGYTSPDEAQEAFLSDHMPILMAAMDPGNYDKLISFDEIYDHKSDPWSSPAVLVFIPNETMKKYGQNRQHARDELVNLVRSYPVRSIYKSDPLFSTYFLCEREPDPPGDCVCDTTKSDRVFFFSLQLPGNGGNWVSYRYYDDQQAASRAFYFFLILLKFKGNYKIAYNECNCTMRLYIREILAISRRRFKSAEEAWGAKGVEKFICASQTDDAFHAFPKYSDCSYGFNVSCGHLGMLHPCTYDTAERRDDALVRLIKATRGLRDKISQGNYEAPVVKKIMPGGQVRYFLDIQLDDFCKEDETSSAPCGCFDENRKMDEGCSCCCRAWVSECCFSNPRDAAAYLRKVIGCMIEPKNYYPVFDCPCGPYRIMFYCDCEHSEQNDRTGNDRTIVVGAVGEARGESFCCNEIIAYNPQHYTSPRMDCDAIGRAKSLINDEGVHLVEHILLRPHCVGKDCDCLIPVCHSYSGCHFEWPMPSDDPCEKGKAYCFDPGFDPYSFIATAVLPAWPERFRKKENRQLMEQLLYREMPSHILLRVLWLSPRDLCYFEYLYRQWLRWLAQKPVCGIDDPQCRLIDFLFNKALDCFNCEECVPCEDSGPAEDPCGRYRFSEKDPNLYVNEINGLFCWAPICHDNLYRRPDRAEAIRTQVEEIVQPVALKETIDNGNESMAIEAERKFDERALMRRETAKPLFNILAENPVAEKAWTFLHELPDFENYHSLVHALLKAKTTVPGQLSKAQKKSLISFITWHYLDKSVVDQTLADEATRVKALFGELNAAKLLPTYEDWHGEELIDLQESTSSKKIKRLFQT